MNRTRVVTAALATLAVLGLGVTLAAGMHPVDGGIRAVDAGTPTTVRDDPAPPLAGTTLAGAPFDLTGQRGRVVLVNVWASWCDPCRSELPALVEADRRWADRGLVVAGINVRDSTEAARDLLAEADAEGLPMMPDPRGTIAVDWGAVGVPETFVVDRAGRIRLLARGPVDTDWLERWIPPVLAS